MTINRTQKELKTIVRAGFRSSFGPVPTYKDIHLLESSGDGTYILFRIGNHRYRFESHLTSYGAVWCGDGTVTKDW